MFSFFSSSHKTEMVNESNALPGRSEYAYVVPNTHELTHNSIKAPFPEGLEVAYFAMGCFWGAERRFWQQAGVYTTAVGYQGGFTPFPTYKEVCTAKTGHTEVVLVVWDPSETSFSKLLKVFWEAHDPTQGMRQGNDVGTQYRSAIYTTTTEQLEQAKQSAKSFGLGLREAGMGSVTTEIREAPVFYYAEDYHQQYLHKNPNGYCGLRGTGVECRI